MYQPARLYTSAKVAFCIHNIAYQGIFAFADFALNLPDEFKSSFDFIDGYDKPVKGRKINRMKAGILESDKVCRCHGHQVDDKRGNKLVKSTSCPVTSNELATLDMIRNSLKCWVFYYYLAALYPNPGNTCISTDISLKLSKMKAEYFPPKEDAILHNEAPTNLCVLVTRAVDINDLLMEGVLMEIKNILAQGRLDLPLSLCFATLRGDDLLLHKLLKRCLDANKSDNNGRTALHIATSKENTNCVLLLLDFRVDLNIRATEYFQKIPIKFCPRMPRDATEVYASSEKAARGTGHRLIGGLGDGLIGGLGGWLSAGLSSRLADRLSAGFNMRLGSEPGVWLWRAWWLARRWLQD
nr:granule-bound starch synthase [Tanacetum cinerariifolium]